MRFRALALTTMIFVAAAAPAPPARGDDKVDVLCDGDLDICKMDSHLLEIRLAVAGGVSFEVAAKAYAWWAWSEDGLECALGTTGNSPELLQACADAGLTVERAISLYGIHNIIVRANDTGALDTIAHRPEVRGIVVATNGTSNPPPTDPAQSRLLRIRSAAGGALLYEARAEWPPEGGGATVPVSIRVGDVDVVSGELAPGGRSSRRWVLRTGTKGHRIVVTLDTRTGALRLRATGIDMSGIDRAADSVRVDVRLGTLLSRDDLDSRRDAGRATTWRPTY